MKKNLYYPIVLSLLSFSAIAASAEAEADNFVKGRILVQAKDGVSDGELEKILNSQGGRGKKFGRGNTHIVELPSNASEKAVIARLANHPSIKFAELDRKVKSTFVPNDVSFHSQWFLPKIETIAAWDTTQGEGVTIAILDSGVDGAHPDLAPNLVAGYNNYNNNTDTSDVCGHGTGVAGTAAATSNNSIGVAGVAGKAKIMPMRIAYYDSTSGCWGQYSTISAALYWAADHGARIANISYGGVLNSSSIATAAQYFKSKGGLVFVSAGNSGVDENSAIPAHLISVSATDSNDVKTSWSNFGATVSLAAPGAGIYTTKNGGGYGSWNGTSFASPIAAGVAALMMSARPDLPSSKIESLLFSSALDLGAAGKDIYFGHGRVDAKAAVAAAMSSPVSTVDTQAPSVNITSPSINAVVSGTVAVSVSAADNVGVAQVQLKVNGAVVGVDTTLPYSFNWNTTTLVNGAASIVAVATDAAGNVKSSTTVNVTISNQVVADTIAPKVNLINPAANAIVNGNVNISTSATDNNGAAGIKQSLYINGVLKASGTGAALSYNWNTKKVSSGAYKIEVIAKDAAGNSSSVYVFVTKR